jgi:hypothetical protein
MDLGHVNRTIGWHFLSLGGRIVRVCLAVL